MGEINERDIIFKKLEDKNISKQEKIYLIKRLVEIQKEFANNEISNSISYSQETIEIHKKEGIDSSEINNIITDWCLDRYNSNQKLINLLEKEIEKLEQE